MVHLLDISGHIDTGTTTKQVLDKTPNWMDSWVDLQGRNWLIH